MDGVKQNYRARSRLEVFYTGGCVRLSSDGTTLACACADEAKVSLSNKNQYSQYMHACRIRRILLEHVV